MQHFTVRTAASFLGVDWGSFVVVFLVALVATVVVVISYAVALRMLAVGAPLDEQGGAASLRSVRRPVAATVGAIVCLAVGAAAVLYGIWLIIPQFH